MSDTVNINKAQALTMPGQTETNAWLRLMPWLAGSGMAMGQAALATACSLPTLGKCVGCGSCVVGVATLYGWAMKNRQADRQRAEQGLEPFEIRTAVLTDQDSGL